MNNYLLTPIFKGANISFENNTAVAFNILSAVDIAIAIMPIVIKPLKPL